MVVHFLSQRLGMSHIRTLYIACTCFVLERMRRAVVCFEPYPPTIVSRECNSAMIVKLVFGALALLVSFAAINQSGKPFCMHSASVW